MICSECLRKDHSGHRFEQIIIYLEYKMAWWKDYFLEQRGKVDLLVASVDKNAWETLDY